jgi:hypothetical protein
MKLFSRFLMFMNLLEWEDKLWNGTVFLLQKYQLIQKFLQRWATYTSKSKMNFKLYIIIKKAIDIIQQKLMWFLV